MPEAEPANDPRPLTSFVIPAWNEAPLIGRTIEAIREASDAAGIPSEIIVVDDASDDGTADVATSHGARVHRVEHRNIAAVRNAGAAEARGDRLIFVDADTIVTRDVVAAATRALDGGAAGGGALVRFDRTVPIWARLTLAGIMTMSRLLRLASGCFVFCRRDAFDEVGGFDDRYYATEEWVLSRAMRRVGRFVIVPHTVVTDARKVDLFGMTGALRVALRLAIRGPEAVRRREGLEVWYGDDCREARPAGASRTPPDQ